MLSSKDILSKNSVLEFLLGSIDGLKWCTHHVPTAQACVGSVDLVGHV